MGVRSRGTNGGVDGRTVRFEPLGRRTLPDEIRDRLIATIDSGELVPGAVLPAERTLCAEFNVARTSVREAIQSLVSLGYLERRGNRAYVVEQLPNVDLASDGRKLMVRDLFETRRVIEVQMAELAACRATDAQRDEIFALAGVFRPGMALDEFRRHDREFHWAIARACGNSLLSEVYGKVLDALFSSIEFSDLLYATTNRNEVAVIVERSGQHHLAIAQAIRGRDTAAVVAAVEHHLGDVGKRMIERLV
ncbi:MAG TPA: FadR/GntR family transcriptional regulator [Acidimicrobiales bacterium]|jgi:GntR family transcriptional repressor for pyruvate dehydrogenase complex|nr:FadR/GntR family transcriptional regulator [Acidimicrobiales bacterium]